MMDYGTKPERYVNCEGNSCEYMFWGDSTLTGTGSTVNATIVFEDSGYGEYGWFIVRNFHIAQLGVLCSDLGDTEGEYNFWLNTF